VDEMQPATKKPLDLRLASRLKLGSGAVAMAMRYEARR
jgi:hypothetical protein